MSMNHWFIPSVMWLCSVTSYSVAGPHILSVSKCSVASWQLLELYTVNVFRLCCCSHSSWLLADSQSHFTQSHIMYKKHTYIHPEGLQCNCYLSWWNHLTVLYKTFGLIRDWENNAVSGFAASKKCQKLLAFDSHELGSLSLRKHINSCRSTGPAPADRYFSKNTTLKLPKREDKEAIT